MLKLLKNIIFRLLLISNFDRTVFKTKIIFLFFLQVPQSRASYIETFPSYDVRESLIPQLDGSDPSPKSKPIFHDPTNLSLNLTQHPPPVSTVCLDIVLLTSVIFAQKEQEQKWVISISALSQKIPAGKDVIWFTHIRELIFV